MKMPILPIVIIVIAALVVTGALIRRIPPRGETDPPKMATVSKPMTEQPVRPAVPKTVAARPFEPGLLSFAQAAHRDPADVAKAKANYFCDLARSYRARCESIPRNVAQLEFCLKANGYYTNSRHCGYQP